MQEERCTFLVNLKSHFTLNYIKSTKIGLRGVLKKLNSKVLENHIKVGKNL